MDTSNKYKKASLTIEAVISFTCYLVFLFLLLSMVKISMITIVVNGAANEAAKQIATSAYPLSFINGKMEDMGGELEELAGVGAEAPSLEQIGSDFSTGVLDAVMSGDIKDIGASMSDDATGLLRYFSGKAFEPLFDVAYTGVTNLISRGTTKFVGSIINSYIDDSNLPIDKSQIKVRIAKIPLPEQLYSRGIDYSSGAYSDFNISKSDIDKNDVVIGIEYDYKIALPFLGNIDLKFRDASIEQAWMTGCSSHTVREEGIKDIIKEKVYYKGSEGYSKCYHKKDCRTLWRGKVRMSGTEGLRPCKVCNP